MSSFAFELSRLNGTGIAGIAGTSYERRDSVRSLGDDGQVFQTSHAVMRTAPVFRFSTVAARALVTTIGVGAGAPVLALDGTNGFEAYGLLSSATLPGFQAGSVHARRQVLNGAIAVDGFSWSSGDALQASVSVFGLSTNGTTDPVVSTLASAPAQVYNTEQMALSSCTIAASALTRISNVSVAIAHGIENSVDPGCYQQGLPHPTLLATPGPFGNIVVEATIDTLDLTTAVASTGAVVLTFTSLNHLGVGLAANTLTITLNATLIREDSVAGRPGVRRLSIRASHDGTNRPLVLATA